MVYSPFNDTSLFHTKTKGRPICHRCFIYSNSGNEVQDNNSNESNCKSDVVKKSSAKFSKEVWQGVAELLDWRAGSEWRARATRRTCACDAESWEDAGRGCWEARALPSALSSRRLCSNVVLLSTSEQLSLIVFLKRCLPHNSFLA